MPPARRKAPPSRTQLLASFIDKTLLPDLRARAKEPAIAETLHARWDFERALKRTAAALPEWTDLSLTQVAVAWVLSAVFVRVLEDRGLVAHARLAGRDARDSEQLFYEQFSGLGARDYVLTVFTEVSRSPITADLLGPGSNPAWTLGPSHEAVRALLTLLRDESADGSLTLRFDDPDTRFLGDLYQDLSADVRERYALLQTPDFVETFILDHTLEPALQEFPIAALRVIDPTCGSGHFLLGALRRLFLHLRAQRPHDDPRALVGEALAKVYGADINPYAVAVARFRLLLESLALGGFTQLRDAPALPALTRNVVVADSLLLGAEGTRDLAELALDAGSQETWGPRAFDFQDPPAVRAVFRQRYHAVVGNPPYITCKDAALRETYRAGYPESAQRQYALAAPFTERFFTLATEGGYVGLINANSFMKREFGKSLVEKVLPRYDLTHVIDTSGAYIPGHGTPTVILFGRHRPPAGGDIRAVLGRRGEPETPSDPTKGKVWSSIAGHLGDKGFENEFVTITDVERATFNKHPWSLGGGGAGELKEFIEVRCPRKLDDLTAENGFASFTGLDDVFIVSKGAGARIGVPTNLLRPIVTGESVRDWILAESDEAITPYDEDHRPVPLDLGNAWGQFLWLYRTSLGSVMSFGGKTRAQCGENWWEWYRWQVDRYATTLRITFPSVATHNSFCLERGGRVFSRSAPVLILSASAADSDYTSLLAWLNSSTACFFLKQVSHSKTNHTDDRPERGDLDMMYFDFSGRVIGTVPVPSDDLLRTIAHHSERMEAAVKIRAFYSADAIARQIERGSIPQRGLDAVRMGESGDQLELRRQVAIQENLDWQVYGLLGLCPPEAARPIEFPLADQLPVERRLFLSPDPPAGLSDTNLATWNARREALAASAQLQLIENPANKRRWAGIGRGSFGHGVRTYEEELDEACWSRLLDRVESVLRESETALTAGDILTAVLADEGARRLLDHVSRNGTPDDLFRDALSSTSIPWLAALRHTEEGLAKRARWEHTWDLQRREDRGESVGEIPVPPKYDREDYRDPRYWSLRGKLDVPRERFIAYPGAESDPRAPLFGWAGWDHLQRARALASLYQQRKTVDGWDAPRLLPLLAGLRELHFWITLWHDAPDPELDGMTQGAVWAEFIEGERAALGCSEEDLRAWRPAAKTRKGRVKS